MSKENESKEEKKDNEEKLISEKANNDAVTDLAEEKTLSPILNLLKGRGLEVNPLERDHIGIEIIEVNPNSLIDVACLLKDNGFDYLQCQGGYDEGPGQRLVSFYHLVAMSEIVSKDNYLEKVEIPREVRLKVFLSRDGSLKVPSLYKVFKGSDWQERETFDMFGICFEGHPHPKRLLMPEDWKGWPLRKDYVQPDFYEMQDAF